MKNIAIITFSALCALFSSSEGLARTKETKPEKPAEKPAIVAKINGEEITREVLEARMDKYYSKQVLQLLIAEKLLTQEAKRMGVSVSKREINDKFELRKADIEKRSNMPIEKALATRGKTLDLMRDAIKVELMQDKVFEAMYPIEEKLINAELKIHNKLQVKLILLKDLDEARDIDKRLKNGENFEAIAQKESIHKSSKAKGGLLDQLMNRTNGNSVMERTLFSLKENEISGVIPFRDGKHFQIYKCVKRIYPSREEVILSLRNRMIREQGLNLLSDLQNKAEIENFLEKK